MLRSRSSCCGVGTRSAKLQRFIRCAVPPSGNSEDPYKYSDHVVYTEKFMKTVKHLDRIWRLSSVDKRELKPVLVDGRWFVELIERQFSRRYECQVGIDVRGDGDGRQLCLYIGPYIFDGRDYEGYLMRMNGVLVRLVDNGIELEKISAAIEDVEFNGEGRWVVRF